MASVQDRLKLKRVPYDTWSTREQLCLATSVSNLGENVQNWKTVSESLKPFAEKEALRPPDWFSQKSCTVQYSHLLETADTPKRKKRDSGETNAESIVNRLTQERIAELKQILAFQRDEYQQLKAEVNLLKCGPLSDEKLQKMWQAIEQEEREQEQKARAHTAWLAKRQQKQELSMLQSTHIHRIKPGENSSENNEVTPMETSSTGEEDEKKRGGRSPLLTSLLKSTSPTTQIQTPPTTAQAGSPTIASLLVSSPKVPNSQLERGPAQNVSSNLQQFVSTAIVGAASERPSAGAPTLSMLLELPANTQRGPLPNLQTPQANATASQPPMPPEIHTPLPKNVTTTSENVVSQITQPAVAVVQATQNIPVTESMVQIIDHIDEVIGQDIMADVIDKDEINEIIGDIEELIKEEITASPTTNSETPVVETPTTVQETAPIKSPEVVVERQEPRNVDDSVEMSDSPESEMAIEEIDSSTSNIAEIIGTVAVESTEPKIVVPCESPKVDEKPKEESAELGVEENMEDESLPEERRNSPEDKVEDEPVAEKPESSPKVECCKESESNESTPTEAKDSEDLIGEPDLDAPETNEDAVDKDEAEKDEAEKDEAEKDEADKDSADKDEAEKDEADKDEADKDEAEKDEADKDEAELIEAEKEDSGESTGDEKEIFDETENKDELEIDQLEIHLAEITGDPQEKLVEPAPSSESSDATNDAASIEDTEKSQDISLILEDDESSQGSQNKDKTSPGEAATDVTLDTSESCQEESAVSTEEEPDVVVKIETVAIVAEEAENPESAESKDNAEEENEVGDKNDTDESSANIVVNQVDEKEPEESTTESGTDSNPPTVPEPEEEVKKEPQDVPEQPEKTEDTIEQEKDVEEAVDETEEVKTERKEETEMEVKEEPVIVKEEAKVEETETQEDKPETKEITEPEPETKKETAAGIGDDVDLDEEESSLSKLSGGRMMKTYSKRQAVTIDSEPENEGGGEGADYRAWKKAVMLVFNRLVTHKYASVFLRPITEDQAPGYHSVIFRPMDLSTIKKNIDNGTIRSTMHFQRDVMLMFQNAIMYNKQDTFVYQMAVSMQEECLQHMQILVQVTGEGPFRRETRTAASSSSDFGESSTKPQRKRSHITPSPHDSSDSPRTKKRRKSEND